MRWLAAAALLLALLGGAWLVGRAGEGRAASSAAPAPLTGGTPPVSAPAPAATSAGSRSAASGAAGSLAVRLELDCPAGEPPGFVLTRVEGEGGRREWPRVLGTSASWGGLSSGAYAVAVDGRGFEPARIETRVPAGGEARELISLQPVNQVRGTAVDASSLLPLASCEARVETRTSALVPHSTFLPWSSAAGGFCFAGVPPLGERMRVHVRASGYEPAASDWLDARGFHDEVRVELTSTAGVVGYLEGRIRDARDSRGVTGADLLAAGEDASLDAAFVFGPYLQVGDQLRVGGAGDPERGHSRSGADGAFRVEVDAPFRGRLMVYHPEYRIAASGTVELSRPGQTARVEVFLETGATLRGRIVSSDESPERPGRIDITGPQRSYFIGVREDGTFSQGGLEDGLYRVQLNVHRRSATGAETVVPAASELAVIEDGRDVEVTLHLGSGLVGTVVEGRVLFPDDEALGEWMVTVLDPLQAGRGLITTAAPAADGTFLLRDVPAGDLTLFAVGRSSDDSHRALAAVPLTVRQGELPPPVVVDASGPRIELLLSDYEPAVPPARLGLDVSRVPLFAGTLASETWLFVDAGGRAVVHGLPPGTYTVRLAAVQELARELEVPADRGATLQLRLR